MSNELDPKDYMCKFENTHDDRACQILRIYDAQASYSDGSPKPAREMKSLSWYAEKHGYTTKQLKEHWRCIEE